jgi:hypothetical protein
VDVSARLQAWINSVPDNSVLTFPKGRCYRVDETLLIQDRKNLDFEGVGATIKTVTEGSGTANQIQTRRTLYFYGGSGYIIHGLTIVGPNPTNVYAAKYAGQHGIAFAGVHGAVVDDVTIKGVHGDFVYVGADLYRSWHFSSNIVVENSAFDTSGRMGVSVTAGQDITVVNNTMTNVAMDAVDIEPDVATTYDSTGAPKYGGAIDVNIVNNTIGVVGQIFLGNQGAAGSIMNGLVVRGNRLTAAPLIVWIYGSAALHRTNFTIADNVSQVVLSSPRDSVELLYVDNAVVSGNTAPGYYLNPTPMSGVGVWSATNVTVSNNNFTGDTTALAVNPSRFGKPWTGPPSTRTSACGNRFGPTTKPQTEQACH